MQYYKFSPETLLLVDIFTKENHGIFKGKNQHVFSLRLPRDGVQATSEIGKETVKKIREGGQRKTEIYVMLENERKKITWNKKQYFRVDGKKSLDTDCKCSPLEDTV